MLETLNNLILLITDPVLNWLLHLPGDVALFVVAIATSCILTFVRLITTNQDFLRRCARDKKRLKALIREARQKGDKEARQRYRATLAQISTRLMKAEGKPLLVSLVPIALLAVWCFGRLGFLPPQPGEPVDVKVCYRISAIGSPTYLVPQPGLEAVGGWVKLVVDDPDTREGVPPNGMAVWTLTGDGSQTRYDLQIVHAGRVYTKAFEVGGRTYAPDVELYGEDEPVLSAELKMKPLKLFGIVPGIPWIMFPPWLTAYLAIAIPFVFLLKWLTGIR